MGTYKLLSYVAQSLKSELPAKKQVVTSGEVTERANLGQVLSRINYEVELRLNTRACSLTELAQVKVGQTIRYSASGIKYEVGLVKRGENENT